MIPWQTLQGQWKGKYYQMPSGCGLVSIESKRKKTQQNPPPPWKTPKLQVLNANNQHANGSSEENPYPENKFSSERNNFT